ncbi:MAG: transcriptional regulator NrdR [Nanoarchaeota archaeon]|nr:transcriptional regulator NrdR [Nanoarchaeota archaeon]MBU1321418.1 transcriptional regulator NrdR [Nanoarchaeota archaeon]MBU1597044.1 transcriptional regulator NrdR [Nanoarchaeota archaeon]MBU2440834.1 transcriptional regulator NrdR [Nanoarchaeota archaeon]
MKCPFCSSKDTRVVETRETEEEATRRRRECLSCKKRFTTYEKIENFSLRVIKKDGNREFFDKEKLRKGLLKACEKRPVSNEQVDKIVDDIEKTLRNMQTMEVKSSFIGDLVIKHLKKLDSVAYIRFASVYRDFKDIGEFEKELKLLKNKNNNNKTKLKNKF